MDYRAYSRFQRISGMHHIAIVNHNIHIRLHRGQADIKVLCLCHKPDFAAMSPFCPKLPVMVVRNPEFAFEMFRETLQSQPAHSGNPLQMVHIVKF